MAKKCVLGGGSLVGSGGDRHAKGHCPPTKGVRTGERFLRQQRKKRHAKNELKIQRGVAIAGTGVPKGD